MKEILATPVLVTTGPEEEPRDPARAVTTGQKTETGNREPVEEDVISVDTAKSGVDTAGRENN
jgi:hypothetical protein